MFNASLFDVQPARLCYDSGQDVQNADNSFPSGSCLIPTVFILYGY